MQNLPKDPNGNNSDYKGMIHSRGSHMEDPHKNPRDLFVHRVAVLAVDEFAI